MENVHDAGDSELKPEAEQGPCETAESLRKNNPTETETDFAESTHDKVLVDGKDDKEEKPDDSPVSDEKTGANAIGIGDEHDEATEDERKKEALETETNAKQEKDNCKGE